MNCSCKSLAVQYEVDGVKVIVCPMCDRIRCHSCRQPVLDGRAQMCKCGVNVSLSR